jgi:O-methyltransferase
MFRRTPLKIENAQLLEQLHSVGKERDDLRRENDALRQGSSVAGLPVYDADGLKVWGKNVGFLTDKHFQLAYAKGMNSGHAFVHPDGSQIHSIEWRIAVTTWAAVHGAKLEGDFVECGVNTGAHSLAICHYLDFNALGKKFYLFDTYCGLPEEQMSAWESSFRKGQNARVYPECYEIAKTNFAPFPGAILVRGKIPDTLDAVSIDKVAYLSIDMNLAYPEKCALEFFWPKLLTGAVIVLDDYAWVNCYEQKAIHDAFARSRGTEVLTLPTGQGLLIKF